MRRAVLGAAVLALGLGAGFYAIRNPAPAPLVEEPACDSCTARHKAITRSRGALAGVTEPE